MFHFSGFKIIESIAMVVYAGEDWSKVRSPSRARRRMKKHRQNITALYKPDQQFIVDKINNTIYCHPEMARELYKKAKENELTRPYSPLYNW